MVHIGAKTKTCSCYDCIGWYAKSTSWHGVTQVAATEQVHRPRPSTGPTGRLTVFGRKDFLVCDQFLTKTHHKVDVLRSSALCLLPLLVIPVVYSGETKENVSIAVVTSFLRKSVWNFLVSLVVRQLCSNDWINRHEWLVKNVCGSIKQEEETTTRPLRRQQDLFPHSRISASDSISLSHWRESDKDGLQGQTGRLLCLTRTLYPHIKFRCFHSSWLTKRVFPETSLPHFPALNLWRGSTRGAAA